MCRHVAYWGPPIRLAALAIDAPRSLVGQCTNAKEMLHGCENLDGWGFAWFDERGGPHHYRTALPMPDDRDGLARLEHTSSSQFLIHARQKSPGSATVATGSAPFWDGASTFFAHNGVVSGFRDGGREQLLARVTPRRRAQILGDADSEVLFALVLDRIDAGKPAGEALSVLAEVHDEFGGRYNVLFADGSQMIATRLGNSLYVREDDAVTVASEPLDDGPWSPLPDSHMLVVDEHGLRKERW